MITNRLASLAECHSKVTQRVTLRIRSTLPARTRKYRPQIKERYGQVRPTEKFERFEVKEASFILDIFEHEMVFQWIAFDVSSLSLPGCIRL